MPNPKKEYKNRSSLTPEEIQIMLDKADTLDTQYFCLRSKAIVSLFARMGKRRSEVASILRKDVRIIDGLIFVTYTIRKKHKKGVFQYIKWLRKHDPTKLELPFSVLSDEPYNEWVITKDGFSIKTEKRTKKVPIKDKYMKNVLVYLDYLDSVCPNSEYLFPSGITFFGLGYKFLPHKHLTGRQLLNLIKQLNERAWCHLFRDFVGGQIARKHGDSLIAVAQVKRTLDLEKNSTAMIYINRHSEQLLDYEEE